MKLRLLRLFTAVPIAGLLVFQAGTAPATITANAGSTYDHLTKIQKRILSGFASLELDPATTPSENPGKKGGNFFPTSDDGCPMNLGSNIKVNQNCLNITDADLQGRGQAQNETTIAQDPMNPQHVVASSNDYRRGDGNCFSEYSRDGGSSWTDTSIPMGFTRGTAFGAAREYWQAGGDPAVAWDTKGNAYMQCMMFLRGKPTTNNPDASSAIYVFRSTGNAGASWNFAGRPAVETSTTNLNVVSDKPYMTIDTHPGSPFQDRIYISWTAFAADGSAYIYEVHSNNYGQSFSSPVVVSGDSPLCVNTFPPTGTAQGKCNENQFSDPFTGSDGALYVVFDNYNNAVTGADNRNQVLIAKSTDGGATFGAPQKVSDFYDLPDCATYQGGQDPFRACVPEKGSSMNSVFRAANYPVGAVNPGDPSQVVVTVGSYINHFSSEANGCAPDGLDPLTGQNHFIGVKTAGACNNKILLSVSNNAGASFTGTTTDPRALATVNTADQAGTDQWWQWAAFSNKGALAVSYYDRQYGNDETTGFSDFSLSGSEDLGAFGVKRVTSSSMPVPTQFPDAQGNSTFFGDYTGLSAAKDALPLWMDTRDADLFVCPGTGAPGVPPRICTGLSNNGTQANDQDIFTAKVGIPSGK